MPGARAGMVRAVRAPAGGPLPGYEKPQGRAFSRLYHGETNFDFINRWKYWFALSGAVIAIGLVALGIGGLNFSIDFKGGNQWTVPTTASTKTVLAKLDAIDPALSKGTITQLVSRASGKQEISVEEPSSLTTDSSLVTRVTNELAKLAHVPVDKVNYTGVSPSWGGVITKKAVEAVVVFVVLIVIAMSLYFEAKMAFAAFVALIHDMLVTIGIYALSGFQVSPDTVIAFLTVLGYSLYDTIVVFDKVKENTRGLASTNRVTYTDVVNLSMNQVLARSLNTSFVSVMPVFCILVIGSWILGASALNDFGLALFIGLMSGAYSSIFIASPVLALLKEREPRYVEIRRRLAAYPQSRQVLTAANVAGGTVVAAKRGRAFEAPAAPAAQERALAGARAPVGPSPAAPFGEVGGAGGIGGASGAGNGEAPNGDVVSGEDMVDDDMAGDVGGATALATGPLGGAPGLSPAGQGPASLSPTGGNDTTAGVGIGNGDAFAGEGNGGGASARQKAKAGSGRAGRTGAGAGGDAGTGSPAATGASGQPTAGSGQPRTGSASAGAPAGQAVPSRPRPKKKVPRRR